MKYTFDITGFNDHQKRLTHAALSAILYVKGVTHEGIQCVNGVCEVTNPSGPAEVTEQDILDRIAADDEAREIAKNEEVTELERVKNEISSAETLEKVKEIIEKK